MKSTLELVRIGVRIVLLSRFRVRVKLDQFGHDMEEHREKARRRKRWERMVE